MNVSKFTNNLVPSLLQYCLLLFVKPIQFLTFDTITTTTKPHNMLGNHGPRSPTAEGDIPDFVDCDTTDSSETFSDEDVPIIHALPALALPTDEKKPQLTVLESELGPDSPVSPPKKLRILMLHGKTAL